MVNFGFSASSAIPGQAPMASFTPQLWGRSTLAGRKGSTKAENGGPEPILTIRASLLTFDQWP